MKGVGSFNQALKIQHLRLSLEECEKEPSRRLHLRGIFLGFYKSESVLRVSVNFLLWFGGSLN